VLTMKIFLSVLCSLTLAALLSAQTPAAKMPATPKGADKSGKKEEPPAKIEGMEIARGEAGFLGLQIADTTFKLSFYDAKKKPIAADVTRAVLRWNPKYQKNDERVVLERSDDGKSLTSPRTIRPPHNFKLYITLFKEPAPGTEAVAAENYVVDFAQVEK
jgi:hypothetical protein